MCAHGPVNIATLYKSVANITVCLRESVSVWNSYSIFKISVSKLLVHMAV